MLKKIIFGICLLTFTLVNFQDYSFAQKPIQKAIMIIASQNFRDEELLSPKDILGTNRVEVILASSSLSPSRGMLGTVVKPDILIEDVNMEDYDAVIFVGGSGAKEFWDDAVAHNVACEAKALEKIIGAICIAPVTLAKAGVLKGKRATVFPGVAREFQTYGVNYTENDLEIDGNIITASGPEVSGKFGEALVAALVRRR